VDWPCLRWSMTVAGRSLPQWTERAREAQSLLSCFRFKSHEVPVSKRPATASVRGQCGSTSANCFMIERRIDTADNICQRYLQVIHNRNGRVARIIDSQNPANPARARRIADEYRAVGPFPTIPQDCTQQEVGHTPVYTSTGSWCCRARVLGSFSVGSTIGSAAHCRGSTLRCEL
jgi:hypothetical protein